MSGERIWWHSIHPMNALHLDLTKRLDIIAPLTTEGERCPWPWEAQLTNGVIGMYHCNYCGAMVLAGQRHIDYRPMLN